MENKYFVGKRFGRLEILDVFRFNQGLQAFCVCDCGSTSTPIIQNLKRGLSKSCGCIVHKGATTHGLSRKHPKEYRAWKAMKRRCDNKRLRNYHLYGGRGIKVCKRWLDSFPNFLKDMGPAPEGLTLDRINTNGDYEPKNCKWSTYQEQANNLRTNRIIRGTDMTAANFARKYNINYSSVIYWHNKKNMSADEILKKINKQRPSTDG